MECAKTAPAILAGGCGTFQFYDLSREEQIAFLQYASKYCKHARELLKKVYKIKEGDLDGDSH